MVPHFQHILASAFSAHQELHTSLPPRAPLPVQPLAGHRRVEESSVRCQPSTLDHIAALLRDHDRGCVGVARGHLRHDAGVDHAKTINPIDLETMQ